VRMILLLMSIFVGLAAQQAWAEGVTTKSSCSTNPARTPQKFCGFDIYIEGEITPATLTGVKSAIAERDQMMKREDSSGALVDPWIISIDSPGGSVDAAIAIGRLLRSMEAPIALADDKICASSCVLVLAGAAHRNLHGRVGIHRPYFETPATEVDFRQVQKAYSDMTEKIRSYLKEMNVSERLADDMMIVPPEKMRFLSSDELTQYGLSFIDPAVKEALDLKEARKLGISHTEYMRRKAQSQVLCYWWDRSGAYHGSEECETAVLAGKHVERAPPCQNRATTCQLSEREWPSGREINIDDLTKDGRFLISGPR
jgi:ATP-dependent protease ClpP protease subunit